MPARLRDLRDLRGIRLFFPLALAWSALALSPWLSQYAGVLGFAPQFPGAAWHGHEMIYGYFAATVAAFLTVGDRGWGMPLFVALWLAGRPVPLTGGTPFPGALENGTLPPVRSSAGSPDPQTHRTMPRAQADDCTACCKSIRFGTDSFLPTVRVQAMPGGRTKTASPCSVPAGWNSRSDRSG